MKYNLRNIVKKCRSYREAARMIGEPNSHQRIKKEVEKEGIDVSHFDFGSRSYSYVGKSFNNFVVRGIVKRNNRWFCTCDCACGKTGVKRRLDSVIGGRVISCGCLTRDRPSMRSSGNPSFTGCGELHGSRVYWIKRGAERRGIKFDLTAEFLWDLYLKQKKKCALSGLEIVFGKMDFPHQTTASLDRIDSSVGYVVDNVQWVHKDVNIMKRTFSQRYFIELCKSVASAN